MKEIRRILPGILLILGVIVIGVVYPMVDLLLSYGDPSEEYTECRRHYVMITDGENEEFWQQVYESARAEALEAGVYVELFGNDLSVTYSRNELLKIAADASVDGIIVSAAEDPETTERINDIVASGIPVVTALHDCSSSTRQCYVGCNNYDIGCLYGQQVVECLRGRKRASVLAAVNGETLETSENLILLGIRETLESRLPDCQVKVDARAISQTGSFATEEFYNELFVDEKGLPDVLICLDAVGTICAYQSSVDHNRVGSVDIVGFYDSDAIVAEVQKQVLVSTLSIDAEQMGALCVNALNDYCESGYTNNYQSVDICLIDKEMADRRMEEAEEQR